MRRRLATLCRIAGVIGVVWLGVGVVLTAIVHFAGSVDEAAPSDAIIVLGAALSRDGTPYRALTRRAEHGAALWKQGQAPVVICSGGVGDGLDVPRSEADGCREVLEREGVPAASIVLEDASHSTRENLVNTRRLMLSRGWTTAILVSDSYHMFRARRLAREAGIDARPSPVPRARIQSPLFYMQALVREVLALQRP